MYCCASVKIFLAVDEDLADVIGQVVAQGSNDRFRFLIDQERSRAPFGSLRNSIPNLFQIVEVPLQLFGRAANAGCANDRAHAVWDLNLVERFAKLFAIFAFDPARYAARACVVRHQHQEATGETDECGQRGAFVAAFFFFDLNDHLLTFVEELANVEASA